jgi:hypothetical protein
MNRNYWIIFFALNLVDSNLCYADVGMRIKARVQRLEANYCYLQGEQKMIKVNREKLAFNLQYELIYVLRDEFSRKRRRGMRRWHPTNNASDFGGENVLKAVAGKLHCRQSIVA